MSEIDLMTSALDATYAALERKPSDTPRCDATEKLERELCERDARIAELSAALLLILTDNGLNPENRAQAREALAK